MMRLIRRALLFVPLVAACALPGADAIALDDVAVVESGGVVFIPVLANDRAPSGETLRITGTTAAVGMVEIQSDGLNYAAAGDFVGTDTFSYTVTTNSSTDAVATVEVTVSDGSVSTTQPPEGETDPPVIEVFAVEPGLAALGAEIVIGVVASDAGSGVATIEILIDGRTVEKCSGDECGHRVSDLADGVHAVRVIAIDGAGNLNEPEQREIVVDGTRPEIGDVVVDPPTPRSDVVFGITATASDLNGIALVEIRVDGELVGECASPPCVVRAVGPLPIGAHLVTVAAQDTVGNQGSRVFELDVVEPLADLVVKDFTINGPAELGSGTVGPPAVVSALVVVSNVGSVDAGEFRVAVRDEEAYRPFDIAVALVDSILVDGLAAGAEKQVSVRIYYSQVPRAASPLVFEVDTCVGLEDPGESCAVREANEENNKSERRIVPFPPVAAMDRPFGQADLTLRAGGVDVDVDGTSSFDPNGGSLRYAWTVERIFDGALREIGTVPAGRLSFDLPPTCETTTDYRFVLTVTDDEGIASFASRTIGYQLIC